MADRGGQTLRVGFLSKQFTPHFKTNLKLSEKLSFNSACKGSPENSTSKINNQYLNAHKQCGPIRFWNPYKCKGYSKA